MFGGLFGRGKNDVRLPEVDERDDVGAVFDTARRAASGDGEQPAATPGRHVIIVTPGRMLKFQPCPPPGSMAAAQVASIEQMISSKVKRNIAAIAFTELGAITKNADKAIPFLGILLGFAYIGHAVWVFEGHPLALSAGCREADMLVVDQAMVPYLQSDWAAVAAKAMRHPEIYVHDRETYSLKKVSPNG
jgi:hypothetical protein